MKAVCSLYGKTPLDSMGDQQFLPTFSDMGSPFLFFFDCIPPLWYTLAICAVRALCTAVFQGGTL